MSVNEIRLPAAPAAQLKASESSSLPVTQPRKTDQSTPADGTTPSNDNRDILTLAEKEYFVKLFPGAAADISSYYTYQKDGTADVTHVGRVVDRKG